MLILDRKRDQKIMIGDEIVLTVVEIRYGSVRIGIEADPRASRGNLQGNRQRKEKAP
jgi:carbon storage regulator